MATADWSIFSPRKLTDDETATLQQRLRGLFTTGTEEEGEDIDDIVGYTLAMVSNHKDVHYVVKELNSMGLEEFCPGEMVQQIGQHVAEYLKEILQKVESPTKTNPADADDTRKTKEKTEGGSRIVSLKSSKGNALTMAGALGASREGGRGKKQPKQERQQQKDKNDNKNNSHRSNDRNRRDGRGRNQQQQQQQQQRGGGRMNQRRDERGRAFDRLTQRDGRGSGRIDQQRRRDETSGRADRSRGGGGGRGFDDRGGPRGARGGRGGRGEQQSRISGTRRDRSDIQEEQDFVPAGRGWRGGREGRGDEGRGRYQHDGRSPNKRMRFDEGYSEGFEQIQGEGGHGYQQGNWRESGGYRGGRGGRGFGRVQYGGRFGEGASDQSQEQAPPAKEGASDAPDTAEAAAGHPSPMVAAAYGRGYAYRGRGRGRGRGYGRGSYYPGRADVQSMLAAKTWVRKKDDSETDKAAETPEDAPAESQG